MVFYGWAEPVIIFQVRCLLTTAWLFMLIWKYSVVQTNVF